MANYFYINSAQQQLGPCSIEELRSAGITPETMVWCEGMADWQKAGMIYELKPLFVIPPSQVGPSVPPSLQELPPRPNNNLWIGIVSTICCCLPLGILSIIFASKVDSCYNRGEYQEAEKNAKNAKTYGLIGMALGLVGSILYIIFVTVTGVLSGL